MIKCPTAFSIFSYIIFRTPAQIDIRRHVFNSVQMEQKLVQLRKSQYWNKHSMTASRPSTSTASTHVRRRSLN